METAIYRQYNTEKPWLRKTNELHEQCNLSLSTSISLNLAVIKGDLTREQNLEKLRSFEASIHELLAFSSHLNLYINISNLDFSGVSHLIRLSKVLNPAVKQGQSIKIYWNSHDDDLIEAIASDLAKLIECPLQFCTI